MSTENLTPAQRLRARCDAERKQIEQDLARSKENKVYVDISRPFRKREWFATFEVGHPPKKDTSMVFGARARSRSAILDDVATRLAQIDPARPWVVYIRDAPDLTPAPGGAPLEAYSAFRVRIGLAVTDTGRVVQVGRLEAAED